MKQLRDMLVFVAVIAGLTAVTALANYLEENRMDKTVTVLSPPHEWHPEAWEPQR